MKPNLPNWLFLVGVLVLGLTNTVKELAPDTLGRITALHWGCAIVSAILFSTGLLLSLRGVFAAPQRPWRFLLPLICNLFFLVALFGVYFGGFVFAAKIYQFGTENPFPDFLPKLIKESQTEVSAEKRTRAAQIAYECYGVSLVYKDAAGNFAAYVHSPKDEGSFADRKEAEAQKQVALARLKGAMDQYPYLFTFSVGALFFTFFVGPFFFAFRQPMTAPPQD